MSETERAESSYFLLYVTSMMAAVATNNNWLLGFSLCLGILMFRWANHD